MTITIQSKFDEKKMEDKEFIKSNAEHLLEHIHKTIVEPFTLVDTKFNRLGDDPINKTVTLQFVCDVKTDDTITLKVPVNKQSSTDDKAITRLTDATVHNFGKMVAENLSKIKATLSNETDKNLPDCKIVYVTCMVS